MCLCTEKEKQLFPWATRRFPYHLLNTNNPLSTTLAVDEFRADLSHSVSEKNVDSFIVEELPRMKDHRAVG